MRSTIRILLGVSLLLAAPAVTSAEPSSADYLRDRGPGIRTSMFGTYVNHRELLVYLFYEYYRDHNFQYSPEEYGAVGTQDFAGHYRANEGLVFLSYGFTDRVAVEMEAAGISATFEKDPADATGTPAHISESGLGDVEGQVTYRWWKEDERRPELFTFFEAVIPHSKDKVLIGTPDWELAFGGGLSRGFAFGTLSVRVAAEYTRASETPWDLGEWGGEYLRRLSPEWRVYAGLEGQGTDELEFITEVQRRLGLNATLKIGTGIGLTANTTDFAPELGILFSFPN